MYRKRSDRHVIDPGNKKIVIMPPRTASRSLISAVKAEYREAVLLYRHMEADGVPTGYDSWEKVGVIRHPVNRLRSMYRFLHSITDKPKYVKGWASAQHESVAGKSFSEWLRSNTTVFATSHGECFGAFGETYPAYATLRPMPENVKSQYVYLRPDLGTRIIKFEDWEAMFDAIGVRLNGPRLNATDTLIPADLSEEAERHISKAFAWDLSYFATEI